MRIDPPPSADEAAAIIVALRALQLAQKGEATTPTPRWRLAARLPGRSIEALRAWGGKIPRHGP